MDWKYTDGWTLGDLSAAISMTDSVALAEGEKKPFISVTCSAASKVLTLGLEAGDMALIQNVGGTNAITVKNVAGDTGTSLAAGKVALVVASQTADATKVTVLN